MSVTVKAATNSNQVKVVAKCPERSQRCVRQATAKVMNNGYTCESSKQAGKGGEVS